MKFDYKGFEIDVERSRSVAGDIVLYYSAFRNSDLFELESGYSETGEVDEWVDNMKKLVDDYLENPQNYDDDI